MGKKGRRRKGKRRKRAQRIFGEGKLGRKDEGTKRGR